MNTELLKSDKSLPFIPENATKDVIVKIIKKHAIKNNSEVIIPRIL